MRLWPEKLNALGSVGLCAITFLTATAGGIAWSIRAADQLQVTNDQVKDHETRLRTVESGLGALDAKVSVVKEDVSWIRSYFDPQRRHTAANP